MYFKASGRTNPVTKKYDSYYRLVESYRNETGRICHRTILNVGFLEDELTPEQLNLIARTLTDMYQQKQSIFPQNDPLITKWITVLWGKIVGGKRLDLTAYDENNRMVHVDTLNHSNVREMGAEWLCYNTWQKLDIDKVLIDNDYSEAEIQLAQTQVISRAVYPASELATARWVNENSAVMELTGYDPEKMNKDRLYKSALKLSSIKDKLEQHLSQKTNELFDIQDKIMLYDLTNTYFEGEKRNSKLAKFGRSKEKRSDCKLVVLALVVNIYGFIKHSSIHEGNFSDSKDIEKVINSLDYATGTNKPVIVLDAGIATKDNLTTIRKKGYHYLCVSRTKLKNYLFDQSRLFVYLETKSKKEVVLKKILHPDHTDYCLEITSEMKAKKEQGMKSQFETRYEEELNKIKASLTKKGGVKISDKVNQRIGRAKQKYPSAQGRYEIQLSYDEKKGTVTDLIWTRIEKKDKDATENLGKYFVRTSMDMKEEVVVWNVYNTIREIESTFRTLKTDLDLRPIYHKKDESTIAHLNLGLLAYWLVNTVRRQLKRSSLNHSWTEIVRIGNTQKVITTSGYNKAGKEITVRKCSEPDVKLKEIQTALKIKHRPFTKLKSVVHKLNPKNLERHVIIELPPS
jgi:Transposase DDE domain